jgi:hypothetical protein
MLIRAPAPSSRSSYCALACCTRPIRVGDQPHRRTAGRKRHLQSFERQPRVYPPTERSAHVVTTEVIQDRSQLAKGGWKPDIGDVRDPGFISSLLREEDGSFFRNSLSCLRVSFSRRSLLSSSRSSVASPSLSPASISCCLIYLLRDSLAIPSSTVILGIDVSQER